MDSGKALRILAYDEGASRDAARRLTVTVLLAVADRVSSGTIAFACPKAGEVNRTAVAEVSPASEPGKAEFPLSPKAQIESEDAGGRYARIVAWQRRLPSKQWSADVAYVTSVMGDGHREPVNQFLVCDKAVAKPCITAELDQRTTLTSSQQGGVLKLLGGIRPRHAAALRPAGKQ